MMTLKYKFEFCGFQRAISQRHAPQGVRFKLQDAMMIHTPQGRQLLQKHNSSVALQKTQGEWLWLSVADGVSVSPHADFASRSFLQVLHECDVGGMAAAQLPARVREAESNWQVRYCTEQTWGASTTLASLFVRGQNICAVNCGDSRIWRLRRQDANVQWQQLSRDHTAWQQMIDEERVTPTQREHYASIYQSLLHSLTLGDLGDVPDNSLEDEDDAIPPETENWLHVWQGKAAPGDVYLLATDGLHETLDCSGCVIIRQSSLPADG